ncbi:MAG: DMT family transporter [Chthoniobacterales bacterium]
MKTSRLFLFTLLALAAFAGNSLLCRFALKQTTLDAASFTLIRILSGALVLTILVAARKGQSRVGGNWLSALALFAYAAAFSCAYVTLSAGTGALLLFAAVQATMILWGVRRGERLHVRQLFGLTISLGGLVALLLPGIAAPPIGGSLLMLTAGVAWGIYSLRGRAGGDPMVATAGNFLRAVPCALLLSFVLWPSLRFDPAGAGYAIASGAIASGLGYAIWYAALPGLTAPIAASVQLSVPVLAAIGGILLLHEPLTWRFLCASTAVLGGIALVALRRRPSRGRSRIP